MPNVTLKERDFDFLSHHIRSINTKEIASMVPSTQSRAKDQWVIELSDAQIDSILDELSDLFVSIGLLNTSYEPNQTGLLIEHLIDIFSELKEWE